MLMLVGLLFTIVILSLLGTITGAISYFIDIPSLLIILIPSIFFMLVTKTYKSIFNYFSCSFKKNYKFSKFELESISYDLSVLINIVLASGVFGFIGGIIAMLCTLDDPSTIGPNFAVSLITGLYAVIISFFIIYPVKAWAQAALREVTGN